MGLFSKKEKEKAPTPPGPPKPDESGKNDSPLPPPPATNDSESQNSNMNSTSQSESFTAGMPEPPTPNNGLGDIKSQIATTQQAPQFEQSQHANYEPSTQQDNSEDDLDSLFDLSDIDSQFPQNEESSQNSLPATREHHEDELKFLKTQDHKKRPTSESIYITTAQFKALLEIVEEVKVKAKDSAERHLRLLDIKSEEDIEYENLKKDFAFIEDKLYEVDSLIFER